MQHLYFPTETLTKRSLEQLVNQLPHPFLLVGDFNARNPAWGDSLTNSHGRVIQDFILTTEFSLLNSNKRISPACRTRRLKGGI